MTGMALDGVSRIGADVAKMKVKMSTYEEIEILNWLSAE